MLSDFYTKTATIYDNAETKDSGGALKDNLTAGISFSCKLDALNGNKAIKNEMGQVIANYVMFCDLAKVTPRSPNSQQIKIDSNYYYIQFVDDTLTLGRNPHLEVNLLFQTE